jgi:hypothetical protein
MSYKTFVNGFPLNASELNTYLMSQVVATFANTTARDEAIDSPAEGQIVYIENTATFLWWTGADWVSFGIPSLTANRAVATDGSGALTASTVTATELGYLSGVTSSIQTQLSSAGGLQLITSQAFSASTAVNVNNVFSATYVNYKVVADYRSSGNMDVNLRMRTSGADYTAAEYFNTGFTTAGNINQSTTTSAQIGWGDVTGTGGFEMNFYRPAIATSDTGWTIHQSGPRSGSYSVGVAVSGGGLRTNRADTGFTIFPSTGNITGTVRVFGVKNS